MARDRKLDASKGVLSSIVVVGHFLEIAAPSISRDLPPGWFAMPQSGLLTAAYLFTMPLYVAFAGLTAKSSNRYHRVLQLLVLFVPVQLVLVLPLILVGRLGVLWLAIPLYALWFLSALMAWLLLLPVIDRWPIFTLVGSVILCLLVAASPANPGLLAYARTTFFLPFFIVGHHWGWAILRISERFRGAAVVGFALLLVVSWYVADLSLSPLWVMGNGTARATDSTIPDAVLGRAGILLVMAVVSFGVLFILPARSVLFERLGERSLSIYLLHPFLVLPLALIHFPASVPGAVFLAAVLVASALTIFICSRPVLDDFIRRFSAAISVKISHWMHIDTSRGPALTEKR